MLCLQWFVLVSEKKKLSIIYFFVDVTDYYEFRLWFFNRNEIKVSFAL